MLAHTQRVMIYHSAVFQANQDRLKHFAIELAEQLIPKGKILTSQANDDSIHFVVQTGSILAGFEFHVKELSASALQGILKVLADLELTRKNGGHLQLKEIKFYILAPSFSQDFLNQIPTSWQGIRLVEWSFIRSDSSEGMFIREIEAPTFQKKTTEKNDILGKGCLNGKN